jgi:hypothetical protein
MFLSFQQRLRDVCLIARAEQTAVILFRFLVISHERHWVFSSGPILACVSWIRMAIGVDAKISDGFTLQPPTEVNLFVGWQVGSREIVKVDPLVVRMCWCDEKKYLRVADILCELVVY